jgi:hypothetical protein
VKGNRSWVFKLVSNLKDAVMRWQAAAVNGMGSHPSS